MCAARVRSSIVCWPHWCWADTLPTPPVMTLSLVLASLARSVWSAPQTQCANNINKIIAGVVRHFPDSRIVSSGPRKSACLFGTATGNSVMNIINIVYGRADDEQNRSINFGRIYRKYPSARPPELGIFTPGDINIIFPVVFILVRKYDA